MPAYAVKFTDTVKPAVQRPVTPTQMKVSVSPAVWVKIQSLPSGSKASNNIPIITTASSSPYLLTNQPMVSTPEAPTTIPT